MKPVIYIDGSEGTTGLEIHERLAGRTDIEIIKIDAAKRKDAEERKKLINDADLVILALPDDAARESAAFAVSGRTRVIDASVAHRTADGWVYGLPELSAAQKELIRGARRVTNPGCHATGAIMLLAPVVEAGLLPGDYPLSIMSLTGYTGGGRKMIQQYETLDREEHWELDAPRAYSLSAAHKHIPEIVKYAKLAAEPAFVPVVADFPQGMQVIIPLTLPGRQRELFSVLSDRYAGLRNVDVLDDSPPFAASNVNADTDKITLRVLGHGDHSILTAQFNNLGKGASGACVQNMNLMLGLDEWEGLIYK